MDPSSMRRGSGTTKPMEIDTNNRHTPLKLFVDAKRKIHEIYSEVANHIKDSTAFLKGENFPHTVAHNVFIHICTVC